jgi:hypothetical protein
MTLLKKVGGYVLGAILLVAAIALFNIQYFLAEGDPKYATLEGRWWAGYYDTNNFGRQWCVGVFQRARDGSFQFALVSSSGDPDVFKVDRAETSGGTFVKLTFLDRDGPAKLEAKQLFQGKRYFLGRLLAGRFRDFWKQNDDVAIRGSMVSTSPQTEFAIEPIADERLPQFWRTYVRKDPGAPSPDVLLASAGFETPRRVR